MAVSNKLPFIMRFVFRKNTKTANIIPDISMGIPINPKRSEKCSLIGRNAITNNTTRKVSINEIAT